MRPVLLRVAALSLALVIVELGVRLASIPMSGPRILLYGTPWHRRLVVPEGIKTSAAVLTEEEAGGYPKYFPHEEKWARDARGSYRVRINNHGLRGPDFETVKAPGVRRVITLGASSTFGFENRDEETYPYYLQQALDQLAGAGRFEVLNFGVPHLVSDQMVSLFRAEGVALAPDVVTVYEGINDSKTVVFEGVFGSVWSTLGRSLLAVELLRNLASAAFPATTPIVVTDAMGERAARHYVQNLAALAAECRRIGARLIVVTQQARSLLVDPERLHGVTYDDEVALALRTVGEGAASPAQAAYNPIQLSVAAMLVVHSHVMRAVRTWARDEHVPLVDGIAVLDHDRDLLLTWVHLAAPANDTLARAIAARIVEPRRPTQD